MSELPIPSMALLAEARAAREAAHAPYSRYHVGAAVVDEEGKVFRGANVENASYGLTVCAERVALWKAVTEGAGKIVGIAVAIGGEEPARPCGACRQVMQELCPDALVVLGCEGDEVEELGLADLLPRPFSLE